MKFLSLRYFIPLATCRHTSSSSFCTDCTCKEGEQKETISLTQSADLHTSTLTLYTVHSHYTTLALQHARTTARSHYSTLALQHARTTARSHYSTLALQHARTTARSHYSTLALQHARTTARSHYSTLALQHARTTAHSHYSTLALQHTRTTVHLHSQAQHCWAVHCSPDSCTGKNSNSHWP